MEIRVTSGCVYQVNRVYEACRVTKAFLYVLYAPRETSLHIQQIKIRAHVIKFC